MYWLEVTLNMPTNYLDDEYELWSYKRRLRYLNDEMRYYIEVIQMLEREMESYRNLIYDYAVEEQDWR